MWPAFLGFHTGGTRVAHLASRVPVVMLEVPLPTATNVAGVRRPLGMYAAKIVLYGLMVEDTV